MENIALNDLSAFKPNAGNWVVVASVMMDPDIDVEQNTVAEAVTFQPGKGVLLNMNTKEKKDNLITTWEHGDIELELDVMIPKGSNSGIYFQGNYELQLLDSWGVKNPTYSDIGGIFRNWETDADKAYAGKPPLVNACKAPGLWQTLKVSFQAPKFDSAGRKIANAKFLYVELNGVKIHENVEIPHPTGDALLAAENKTGPLMIQGDHGAVAFRNIKYKLMKNSDVYLSTIRYKFYKGTFDDTVNLYKKKPLKSGTVPSLTWEVAETEESFAITFNGIVNIPEDDEYFFNLKYVDAAFLKIDDSTLRKSVPIFLKKGAHPFKIYYLKNSGESHPALGLYVFTNNTHPKALHLLSSFVPDISQTSPILVRVENETKTLRAFLDFNGDNSKRLTHTIAVGEPAGIHYIYDLEAGTLSCVWRGEFIDATPMWLDRGDGSYRPFGAVQYLFMSSSFANLEDSASSFPMHYLNNDYKLKGYEIKNRPVFYYTYKGVSVTDKISPDTLNRMFIREITFKNISQSSFYFKLAEGKDIFELPDERFVVDQKYFIHVLNGSKAVIRKQGEDKKELILKVDGQPLKYSITW